MTSSEQIRDHLSFVYGPALAPTIYEEIQRRLETFRQRHPELTVATAAAQRLTETDSVLITYGDQIQSADASALQNLAKFLNEHLKNVVSAVHILPFYPYSSDDGFSVIDYTAVDPALGSWADVGLIKDNFRLMVDAVINHISAKSDWFQAFLRGDPAYQAYFISQAPNTDLSSVTRPRTHPLLTPFDTATGAQHIWTTFSADQIDLNYANPQVLLEIIDVLLLYVSQGAELIRLDAIAFMWKEVGTTSLHLPQTHRIIQLFRTILDSVAPNVLLVTETNVPHQENISYFGDGHNEAQMVYQFPLAPLILHTFHTGDATVLQKWAAGLDQLPNMATYFNFIASHDGIGLRPAEGLLRPAEIQALADKTEAHRGQVSYKSNPDGAQSPYELNITLFDALSNPQADEPAALQIDRFMASQAIMLAMIGVPGIYVHSLFGSSNDQAGVETTGRARSINRQKWSRSEIETMLSNPDQRSYKVFERYVNLLQTRQKYQAFHPNGTQQILESSASLFILLRTAPQVRPAPQRSAHVLCLHNISVQPQPVNLDLSTFFSEDQLYDILLDQQIQLEQNRLRLTLAPYEVKWLSEEAPDR